MTAFLSSVLAGVIAQSIRAFLKRIGLEQEFAQLVMAMFLIVTVALSLFTGYLGLKAILLTQGIEIHWLSPWLCPPEAVCS